jgi:tRNA dimethylallyltransferase
MISAKRPMSDGNCAMDVMNRPAHALDTLVEQVLAQAVTVGSSPVLAFVGPTASGKTELAVAVAERLGTSVLSVDSVQVYRHFDVGTGKPTPSERARAPHLLVSMVEPAEAMDASIFGGLADACIAHLHQQGKPVVLCGGTYLWLKSLIWGLAEAPPRVDALRSAYEAIASAHGAATLHARLTLVDPVIAARLHPNDVLRVSRALEVFESTGKRLSELQAAHAFKTPRYPAILFARRRTLEDARARIEARVDSFLENDWIEETRTLIGRGYAGTRPMTSVGYAEICEYLEGKLQRGELRDKIVHSTWVFARRQRTWLNHEPIVWLGEG